MSLSATDCYIEVFDRSKMYVHDLRDVASGLWLGESPTEAWWRAPYERAPEPGLYVMHASSGRSGIVVATCRDRVYVLWAPSLRL